MIDIQKQETAFKMYEWSNPESKFMDMSLLQPLQTGDIVLYKNDKWTTEGIKNHLAYIRNINNPSVYLVVERQLLTILERANINISIAEDAEFKKLKNQLGMMTFRITAKQADNELLNELDVNKFVLLTSNQYAKVLLYNESAAIVELLENKTKKIIGIEQIDEVLTDEDDLPYELRIDNVDNVDSIQFKSMAWLAARN